MGVDAVIVLLDGEHFAAQLTCRKIDEPLRIESLTHETSLKVQVWTCAATSATTITYDIARLDKIVLLNGVAAEVTIVCLETAGVANDYKIAITTRLFGLPDHAHLAIKSGANGITDFKWDVRSLMWAAAAECELRTHVPDDGAYEIVEGVDKGNRYFVGHLIETNTFVGMDGLIVPVLLKIIIVELRVTKIKKLPRVVRIKNQFGVPVVSIESVEHLARLESIGYGNDVLSRKISA